MENAELFYFKVRVYAEDVDYMGIVYHANYLRFYERARTEALRAQEIVLSELQEKDTLFAIRELNIKYFSPAKMDNLLIITTKMHKVGIFRFICEQKMYNSTDKLLSEAKVEVVSVNSHLKPKRFPA